MSNPTVELLARSESFPSVHLENTLRDSVEADFTSLLSVSQSKLTVTWMMGTQAFTKPGSLGRKMYTARILACPI